MLNFLQRVDFALTGAVQRSAALRVKDTDCGSCCHQLTYGAGTPVATGESQTRHGFRCDIVWWIVERFYFDRSVDPLRDVMTRCVLVNCCLVVIIQCLQ